MWELSQVSGEVIFEYMLETYAHDEAEVIRCCNGMTVLFIAHHLLVDGRGLLEIAQEFANDYMGAIAPVYVEEALLESIDDLPQKSSLSGISKMLVNLANRQWEKENHAVSYEQYKRFVR